MVNIPQLTSKLPIAFARPELLQTGPSDKEHLYQTTRDCLMLCQAVGETQTEIPFHSSIELSYILRVCSCLHIPVLSPLV